MGKMISIPKVIELTGVTIKTLKIEDNKCMVLEVEKN